MARILCLADTPTLATQVVSKVAELGHDVEHMHASGLDKAFREALRAAQPDLILLELTRALDNPHLYFFMRSDSALRDTPVVLMANGRNLGEQAAILEADGYLNCPFDMHRLVDFLDAVAAPLEAAVAA
jgi:DNA-binding response OmpR family regulator